MEPSIRTWALDGTAAPLAANRTLHPVPKDSFLSMCF